jgi:hypothetical protein
MAPDDTATKPIASHGDPNARAWSRRWVPIAAVALIVFSVGNVLIGLSRPSIPDEIDELIVYDDTYSSVVEVGSGTYDITPPAYGDHAATTLECGIWRVPVENEKAVAALATGAIWLAYAPDAGGRVIEDLEIFAEGERDIFMSPYPGLPAPIVVTAWGYQLYPESGTDPRIASFIRDYTNGEAAPAVGTLCEDGEPVS